MKWLVIVLFGSAIASKATLMYLPEKAALVTVPVILIMTLAIMVHILWRKKKNADKV